MPSGEWGNVVYTIDASDYNVTYGTDDSTCIVIDEPINISETSEPTPDSYRYHVAYTFCDYRAFINKKEQSLEDIRDEADWEL